MSHVISHMVNSNLLELFPLKNTFASSCVKNTKQLLHTLNPICDFLFR